MVTGRLNAIITPVTAAEKSSIVTGLFIISWLRYSIRTQDKTETSVTVRLLAPNTITLQISAGTRASITVSIMLLVVSLCFTCGDGETVSSAL